VPRTHHRTHTRFDRFNLKLGFLTNITNCLGLLLKNPNRFSSFLAARIAFKLQSWSFRFRRTIRWSLAGWICSDIQIQYRRKHAIISVSLCQFHVLQKSFEGRSPCSPRMGHTSRKGQLSRVLRKSHVGICKSHLLSSPSLLHNIKVDNRIPINLQTPFDVTDNSVGRILKIGPKYYSVAYSCYFHEIDPDTLETIGTLDSWNSFGANSFTPEYVQDKEGNIYFMGSVLKPTLSYMPLILPHEIAESSEPELNGVKVLGHIPPRWSFGGCGMRTCFAITENYFIFIEAPWVISLIKFAATFIQGYSMKNWLDWYPEEGTRICIVDKTDGRVIQTEIYAPAFIVSSIINAYEAGNEVMISLNDNDY